MNAMSNQQQTDAIIDLQTRVGALESRSGAPPSPPPGTDPKYGLDFQWNNTALWLDVTIPAGQTVSRNVVPPAGWSGQLEFAAGKLAQNQTDRIRSIVKGAGGVVLHDDGEWMNVSGYGIRCAATGPAVIEITSEKDGHISVNCLHQP